jgi:hypothetical protein
MKRDAILILLSFLAVCGVVSVLRAESAITDDAILQQTFELGGEHSQQTQYFLMESQLIGYALDGTRTGTDIFRLRLKCVPATIAGTDEDEYTCAKFTVQVAGQREVEIPALKNWSYVFQIPPTGVDDKGQTLGIEHAPFENLMDSRGNLLSSDTAYHVYNAFIDFHSLCNVFVAQSDEGDDIGDLKSIGQKIVHFSAFSEAPVNLAGNVAEGSMFQNGEVTLEFKGLSRVTEATCALVGYDSGESSFLMISGSTPNAQTLINGSSHYMGDIYIDLVTNWVMKANMNEFVVIEMTVPTSPDKINSAIERNIIIRNVDAEEFAGQSYPRGRSG